MTFYGSGFTGIYLAMVGIAFTVEYERSYLLGIPVAILLTLAQVIRYDRDVGFYRQIPFMTYSWLDLLAKLVLNLCFCFLGYLGGHYYNLYITPLLTR